MGIRSTFYAFPRGLFDSSISLILSLSYYTYLSHIIISLSYHIYIDCKPLLKEIFLAQTHSWDLKTVLPLQRLFHASHTSPILPSVMRKTASRRPTSAESFSPMSTCAKGALLESDGNSKSLGTAWRRGQSSQDPPIPFNIPRLDKFSPMSTCANGALLESDGNSNQSWHGVASCAEQPRSPHPIPYSTT